jgi:hypothetical protein
MSLLAKLILLALFPLAVLLRVISGILGRDPLRLKQPAGESFWITRAASDDSGHYFSEASAAEGQGAGGLSGVIAPALRASASLFKPKTSHDAPGRHIAAADREQGIPDEVYTLW